MLPVFVFLLQYNINQRGLGVQRNLQFILLKLNYICRLQYKHERGAVTEIETFHVFGLR